MTKLDNQAEPGLVKLNLKGRPKKENKKILKFVPKENSND